MEGAPTSLPQLLRGVAAADGLLERVGKARVVLQHPTEIGLVEDEQLTGRGGADRGGAWPGQQEAQLAEEVSLAERGYHLVRLVENFHPATAEDVHVPFRLPLPDDVAAGRVDDRLQHHGQVPKEDRVAPR